MHSDITRQDFSSQIHSQLPPPSRENSSPEPQLTANSSATRTIKTIDDDMGQENHLTARPACRETPVHVIMNRSASHLTHQSPKVIEHSVSQYDNQYIDLTTKKCYHNVSKIQQLTATIARVR